MIFASGTGPHDPESRPIRGETIQEQTRHCLENITAILEEAGSSLDKVAAATVIFAKEEDLASMNEEWIRWFPAIRLRGKEPSSP
ncbi:MAG: RidA family protein [Terriglobus roseus]|nr:RidA family protein [Terriglobus roseus]